MLDKGSSNNYVTPEGGVGVSNFVTKRYEIKVGVGGSFCIMLRNANKTVFSQKVCVIDLSHCKFDVC